MNHLGPTAIIVVALAISQSLSAQPKLPVLSYSQTTTVTEEVMPTGPIQHQFSKRDTPERPGQSRRDRARVPILSYPQKQALAQAWHAGYHVGLPLAFMAIVYVESSGCKHVHGDNGLAFGCSQVHASAAYAATGAHIPAWMLSDSNLRALNMAVGARYLQMCIDRFGWPAGAACYNQGLHTKLSRRALSHLSYTRRVLAAMKWLRQLPEDTQ